MNAPVQQPGTAVATRPPAAVAAQQLTGMTEKFKAALPAHIPAERFTRTALSALQNPEVQKCLGSPEGRQSLYNACLRAAQDGLVLDGREAALVRMGDKLTFMPMVAGIMKKARNSGEIATIVAQTVYGHDEFMIDYVTEGPPVVHRPKIGERGEMIGAYALARLRDGTWTQPEFMTVPEIQAVRKRSRAANNGPWVTDFGEMARKTVIRRAAKYWPSSTDKETGENVIDVIQRDDGLYSMDDAPTEGAPATAPAKPARRKGAAQVLNSTATEILQDEPPAGDPDEGRFAPVDGEFEPLDEDVM